MTYKSFAVLVIYFSSMSRNFQKGEMSADMTYLDCLFITKTHLYNFDPIKLHFHLVKLGFTKIYTIFLISAQKHRLWLLVRNASPMRF